MKLPTHRPVAPLNLPKFLKSLETRKIIKGMSIVVHLVDGEIVLSVPSRDRKIDYFVIELTFPEDLIQPYMIVKREPGKALISRYQKTLVGCESHLYLITTYSKTMGAPNAKNL